MHHYEREVADATNVTTRINALLSSKRAGTHVAPIIKALEAHGPVALFGGAVRDLCFLPVAQFRSDLDLVVRGNAHDVSETLRALGGKPNQFGGFRLTRDHWICDAWSLETTWAAREGHVTCRNFEDLLRTTFFNWDSVAYDISHDVLYIDEDYLRLLRSSILEVNLEPNPNPIGNAVRALRWFAAGHARLGPRLVQFVLRALHSVEQEAGASTTSKAGAGKGRQIPPKYSIFFLSDEGRRLLGELQEHVRVNPHHPAARKRAQLNLSFVE